jgi:recombination protein RecT
MRKTIINWAFKFLPKTGISDDMLKTIEADADFEREDFEAWRKEQEVKEDSFKADEKFTPFEEVHNETNQ